MVTFTSRARLAKPAEAGEVVDVAVLNANFDKIDELTGFYLCTSATRPAQSFPGMQIRETDTGRCFSRNASNTSWDLMQSVGYAESYAPGYSGAMATTTNVYTSIHSFYFGPANANPDAPDLLVQGIFALAFTPTSASANTVAIAAFTSDTAGNANSSTDQILNTKQVATAAASQHFEVLPFSYLVRANGPRRYIKLACRRGAVPTNVDDGAGLSYSMSVTPISKNNGMSGVIPGWSVDV